MRPENGSDAQAGDRAVLQVEQRLDVAVGDALPISSTEIEIGVFWRFSSRFCGGDDDFGRPASGVLVLIGGGRI